MRLFRFFSSFDELIGTGEVCGERSPMKYITPADQSRSAAGRFQRAAVISLHPQLSCERLMKQTVFRLSFHHALGTGQLH